MATFLLILWLLASFAFWVVILGLTLLGIVIAAAILAGAESWPKFNQRKS